MAKLACILTGAIGLLVAGCGERSAPVLDATVPDASDADGSLVDAPSPVPDTRPPDQRGPDAVTTKDQIIRACVIAASCADLGAGFSPPQPWFSPSTCVDAFDGIGWYSWQKFHTPDPGLAARLLQCATSADCAAFRSCFGGGWVSLSRCREGGACKGSTLVPGGADSPAFDCASIGATCVELFSGALRACCNDKTCAGSDTVTCNGTTGEYCHFWGAHLAFDCGLTGRVCTTDPTYLCTGTGGACDPQQPVACSGTKASYCAGGKLATVDCAQYPFRGACAAGGQDLPCRPAGGQCSPQSYLGSCAGDQLTLCVNGFEQTVDCAALGFSSCHKPMVGYASCSHAP